MDPPASGDVLTSASPLLLLLLLMNCHRVACPTVISVEKRVYMYFFCFPLYSYFWPLPQTCFYYISVSLRFAFMFVNVALGSIYIDMCTCTTRSLFVRLCALDIIHQWAEMEFQMQTRTLAKRRYNVGNIYERATTSCWHGTFCCVCIRFCFPVASKGPLLSYLLSL